MVGGGGESRALADCDTRRNTGHPPTPETNEDEKGKPRVQRQREQQSDRNRVHTDKAGQLKCRLGNGENGAGSDEDSRAAAETGRERAKESEREVRRAEGRRSRDQGRRKGKVEKEGNWQAEGKWRLAVYTEEKRHLFRAQHPRNQYQSINSTIRSKTTSIKAQ